MWNIIFMVAAFFAALNMNSCGSPKDEKGSPPPLVATGKGAAHALENGSYYIEQVRDLNDGCQKRPFDSETPITQVPFVLSNDGNGVISLDFCSFENQSTKGTILNNRGMVSVIHPKKILSADKASATFRQECRLDLVVKSDNVFEARYIETQSARSQLLRDATNLQQDQCTTSMTITMKKRAS